MKSFLGLFTYILTLTVVALVAASLWLSYSFTKPGSIEDTTIFIVERGMGANRIATELYDSKIIHDPYVFMIATTVLGAHTSLKAGEYEIQPHMSSKDIMELMREGQTVERRFTVREGLTSYESVQIVKAVDALIDDVSRVPPEGALLPNTYDYQKGEPRDAVLGRMQNLMERTLIEICALDEGLSFDAMMEMECKGAPAPLKAVRDVLTLASIVEKETAVAEERERVAGVFINRLNKGIALQTDPTVIYAITKGKHKNEGKGPLGRRLLSKDLQVDDPYNTYKYPGLPPGPIANPGRASLEAVMNPESHKYIYFVADGSGGHVFSKTLSEHNSNVTKWRKIRRQQQ